MKGMKARSIAVVVSAVLSVMAMLIATVVYVIVLYEVWLGH